MEIDILEIIFFIWLFTGALFVVLSIISATINSFVKTEQDPWEAEMQRRENPVKQPRKLEKR